MTTIKEKIKGWRRPIAGFLSLLMAFTLAMPGHTAYADGTELEVDTTLKNEGATTKAMYLFNGSKIDIHGILNETDQFKDNPYSNSGSYVRTTFGNNGYTSFIRATDTSNYGSSSMPGIATGQNGGVQSIPSLGVETQMRVYPSDDNRLIIVEYTVQNLKDTNNSVQLGLGADTQVGEKGGGGSGSASDSAKLTVDNERFFMSNSIGGTSWDGVSTTGGDEVPGFETFSLIFKDDVLGLTPPDYKWIGYYGSRNNNMFAANPNAGGTGASNASYDPATETYGWPASPSASTRDSGLSLGWKIDMGPYEKATRKIAFNAQGPSYYVNAAQGRNPEDGAAYITYHGTPEKPFRTIERALKEIGNKTGYVYIQNYGALSDTVVRDTGVAKQNVTFEAADYDINGKPVTNPHYTLTRSTDKPMFSVSDDTTFKFANLTLDGSGKNAPVLKGTAGTIGIQSGVTIQNAKTTAEGVGSAVDISGSGNLTLTGGTIKDNQSADKAGAVRFAGGKFLAQGNIQITENYGKDGKHGNGDGDVKQNVYLIEGKAIEVTGNLGGSRLGVTTEKTPVADSNGSFTDPGEEVTVATWTASTAATLLPANFISDGKLKKLDGSAGDIDTAFKTGDEKTIVFRRSGYKISFEYVDENGTKLYGNDIKVPVVKANGSTTALPNSGTAEEPAVSLAINDQLTIGAPAAGIQAAISNASGAPQYPYVFKSAALSDSSVGWTLESNGAVNGTVTMPGKSFTIRYTYSKKTVTAKFYKDSAGTVELVTKSGAVGDSIYGVISPSRNGHTFVGWSTTANSAMPNVFGHGSTLDDWVQDTKKFAATDASYYPVFKPDTGAELTVSGEYANADGSIVFRELPSMTKHYLDEVKIGILHAKGYVFDSTISSTEPSNIDPWSGGSVYIGTDFDAKMPSDDLQVHFRYKVGVDTDSNKSDFRVYYVDLNGNEIKAPAATRHLPEEQLSGIAPAEIDGYSLQDARKYYGFERETGTDSHGVEYVREKTDGVDGITLPVAYIVPVLSVQELYSDSTGSFESDKSFSGKMGNRETAIVYVYKSEGNEVPFELRYFDSDTHDENLRYLYKSSEQRAFGSPIALQYKSYYGYQFGNAETDPANTGSFDSVSHDYSATMPLDELRVSYMLHRDPAFWRDITYRSDSHGALERGTSASADLQGSAEPFTASVLIHDGTTEGGQHSYTWGDVIDRKLVPTPVANQYYRFKGWLMDTNGNGMQDSGEDFVTDNTRFMGPATLCAVFEEDPAQWADIYFEAGENGALSGGAASLHLTRDTLWGNVAKPNGVPSVNYVIDGWFDGNSRIAAGDSIENGHTYTLRFKMDPNQFGTDPAAPDVTGEINNASGKGKATVHNTTQGYRYVLTDLDGNVISVQDGNASGITVFDGLDPERRYHVYEAAAGTAVQPGDNVAGRGFGGPTEVLIPAVETNYDVTFDEEEEGKTVLVIDPADPDSDYALIDENGNTVMTGDTAADGWQTPKNGKVTFPGLDYDKTYTVVARRHNDGSTTAEKEADGSQITTNPGEPLEIPKFSIETKRGEIVSVNEDAVNANTYGEAHKGDTVKITANDPNFLYWRLTIGSIPGVSGRITEREFTFTMPSVNLVLTAYYERPIASPSQVTLTDEARGAGEREIALNPEQVADLEEQLTTPADQTLMDQNEAKVAYKLIYEKNRVKEDENAAVKLEDPYTDHIDAYTGAFGLNVKVERYVNGRKVDRIASGSQIPYSGIPFETYVQLDNNDVDNMDYKLYEVRKNPSGDIILTETAMSMDPEESGGLFRFDAEAGKRYILVYSKAFRVYFYNNHETPKYRYNFKVRKGEAPADYSAFSAVETPITGYTDPNSGYEYIYVGWSTKESSFREFDPSAAIKKKTKIYAYYNDNHKEVDKERDNLRKELEDAIRAADDYFLKRKEAAVVKAAVEAAAEVLNREHPRATLEELQEASTELKEKYKPYAERLDNRYADYGDKKTNGGHGGSTGGGGGRGIGTQQTPFFPEVEKNYYVGTNGNWLLVDAEKNEWAFVLNGGIHVTSAWAKLTYSTAEDTRNGWYHFNARGVMDSGWFRDEKGNWYYCNTIHDGFFGLMKTGWHHDDQDGRWYYLDSRTGIMYTGWHEIDGKWYYFNTLNGTPAETYYFNDTIKRWIYMNTGTRPLGSMYFNETTPDGYRVNPDGSLKQ